MLQKPSLAPMIIKESVQSVNVPVSMNLALKTANALYVIMDAVIPLAQLILTNLFPIALFTTL